MARPKCCRLVGAEPGRTYFKPRGIPLTELEEVVLGVDEFEALRLADLEGLYQEAAAVKMKVSRATFGRIVASARQKVADALVNGKALRIEGGNVTVEGRKPEVCDGRKKRRCCEGGSQLTPQHPTFSVKPRKNRINKTAKPDQM